MDRQVKLCRKLARDRGWHIEQVFADNDISAFNGVRTRMFAPWVNVIGWIAALFFLISTIGVVTDRNWVGVFGLVSFLLWCVWIVVVSINLWQRASAETRSPTSS